MMRTRLAMGCLGVLLVAASARAQEAQPPATETREEPATLPPSGLQGVGDIDARVMLNTDVILAFLNVGVGVDVGVLRAGPGVLAIGGEFELGACVSPCIALNLATGWEFSHLYYSPNARVSYHLLPSDSPGMRKLDLYGLVLGGVTVTTTRVTGTNAGSGTDFDSRGSDVGASLGLGAGGKYFFRDNLFVGAEGRLRYSAGEYTYSARAGDVTLSDSQSTWSLSGFNVQFFIGLRL